MSFLPPTLSLNSKKFFHALLSTNQITICPIRNDSRVSPLKTTPQVNELTLVGAKSFFKASKPHSSSVAGDFHIFTSLSFSDLCADTKILNWLNLQGYFIVLCDCQSSDMMRIGFLSRVRSFLWRDDLKEMIKDTQEWQENPFQFRLYFGSISSNKRGEMAPVLMVEVEGDNINLGMDFFCNIFDGETPLSPCGIAYLFLTLYKNMLTVAERVKIIQDINLHTGHCQLIRLYGLQDIDTLVTLKQGVKIRLRKLILNLKSPQSTEKLFLQVEQEAEPASIICAFDSTVPDAVMSHIPLLSKYIRQCVQDEDHKKIFLHEDFSIMVPPKALPLSSNSL
jgi:hypothetical protein